MPDLMSEQQGQVRAREAESPQGPRAWGLRAQRELCECLVHSWHCLAPAQSYASRWQTPDRVSSVSCHMDPEP